YRKSSLLNQLFQKLFYLFGLYDNMSFLTLGGVSRFFALRLTHNIVVIYIKLGSYFIEWLNNEPFIKDLDQFSTRLAEKHTDQPGTSWRKHKSCLREFPDLI